MDCGGKEAEGHVGHWGIQRCKKLVAAHQVSDQVAICVQRRGRCGNWAFAPKSGHPIKPGRGKLLSCPVKSNTMTAWYSMSGKSQRRVLQFEYADVMSNVTKSFILTLARPAPEMTLAQTSGSPYIVVRDAIDSQGCIRRPCAMQCMLDHGPATRITGSRLSRFVLECTSAVHDAAHVPAEDSLVPGSAGTPAFGTEEAPVNASDEFGVSVHSTKLLPTAESHRIWHLLSGIVTNCRTISPDSAGHIVAGA